MEVVTPTKNKTFQFAKIVTPILITQVALYLMTFFDILMTGRYDTYHLAGVTIGSSFWVPVYTGLSGILMGLTPIIAQLVGSKNKAAIRPTVQQGIYVAICLSVIIFTLILFVVGPIIDRMPLEEEVQLIAKRYLIGMSVGLLPLFTYTVCRSFFDALGATQISMFIILLSAPINVLINYMLIFGKFGLPELGGVGAGYASGITYWIVCSIAAVIIYRRKPFSDYQLFQSWGVVSFTKWKEILTIGMPIGFSIFIETSIFSVVTLFMSVYSTIVISAHQIALNFTSLLYMMPLSISMGATILVGQSVGAKRMLDAKQYSYLAISFAVLCSFVSIAILLIFRTSIASFYTTDSEMIVLAAQFFVFAAFFQLSDAFLAPIQGALRGYKDVNMTFIMAIISFWILGLPIGYVTATYTSLGPFGYWIGLIAGLTIGAITLAARLIFIQKKVQLVKKPSS